MPTQDFRFSNISDVEQEWLLFPRDHFDLQPGYSQPSTLQWNGGDQLVQISVTAGDHIAAADIRYTAATGQWTYASMTPNEWVFSFANGLVKLRCRLNGHGEIGVAAEEVRLTHGKKEKDS